MDVMVEWQVDTTKFGRPCRTFRGRKFIKLNNGYYISTTNRLLLSHEIWNANHPDDIVLDGEIIHHGNYIRDDDRIENYEKLLRIRHSSNHQRGKGNSMFGKVGRFRQFYCDWPDCSLPHRKGGLCEKHYALFRYWKGKGVDNLKVIIKMAYRPINEIRQRDKIGRFI